MLGTIQARSSISLSLIAGLFISNYPEALSSSIGMKHQGLRFGRVLLMWSSLVLITGIGAALGALFLSQGWQTPRLVTNTLELLAGMAIPLMLITLGVAVARLSVAGMGRAMVLSFLKLVVTAGIGWAESRRDGYQCSNRARASSRKPAPRSSAGAPQKLSPA